MMSDNDNTFFVPPPAQTASVEEWEKWLVADKKKAAAVKRAAAKQCDAGDLPDIYSDSVMRKVNGVWRQTVNAGFTGSAEDGDVGLEPAVPATQERSCDEARAIIRNRGTSHVRSGNDKRKARRWRRMMKRRGQA